MIDVTGLPAFWGFLGAIIYAAPRLTTCLYAEAGTAHFRRCLTEAVTALLVGTASTAAFSPFLAGYIHATTHQAADALAAMIGMLANVSGPTIIKGIGTLMSPGGLVQFLAETVLSRIGNKGGRP